MDDKELQETYINQPECYITNSDPYSLCSGNEDALYDCKWCSLYADYMGDELKMVQY